MNTEHRWLQLAVVVPLVGLLVLIARAEVLLRSGASFRIAIEGYDPRDLLAGHYLQYRFAFDWQGQSSCGLERAGEPLQPGCCVCLASGASSEALAVARQVPCDQVSECAGWLRANALVPPLRYFVPERQASSLEEALRGRQAALEVTCGPNGQPAVGDLYLDGRPWRELLPD